MKGEKTTLTRFEFLSETKRGRKFEGEVQQKIRGATFGTTYNNVKIEQMEFDVIVVDYPVMTFVEVKAYRTNFRRDEVRKALIKLVRNCVTITEDDNLCYHDWIPRRDKWETLGNRRWLLKKLGCTVFEGWRFRMLLIVPDKSFIPIMSVIEGKKQPYRNLLEMNGYPLLVIPKRRINEIF